MPLYRVSALALVSILSLFPALAGNRQPTPAALLDERAFAVPVDHGRLTFGRATAATAARVTLRTPSGDAVVFGLGGIMPPPAGRFCLHPDSRAGIDCGELARSTLATLLGDREVGCLAPSTEQGECYLAHDGAWYSVNRLLVRSGMVRALAPRYHEAERRSRAEGAGLWDPVVYPSGEDWRDPVVRRPAG